jgi:hypothetical protein
VIKDGLAYQEVHEHLHNTCTYIENNVAESESVHIQDERKFEKPLKDTDFLRPYHIAHHNKRT